MPYRKLPPKRWPAGKEVRMLARQNSVKAMTRLIELMDSRSQFVAVNAARTVLMRGEPEIRRNPRFKRIGGRGVSEVNVKIAQFKAEEKRGSDKRERELPVVQGRRKGSRDLKPADAEGMPTVRGKRPDLRDEP